MTLTHALRTCLMTPHVLWPRRALVFGPRLTLFAVATNLSTSTHHYDTHRAQSVPGCASSSAAPAEPRPTSVLLGRAATPSRQRTASYSAILPASLREVLPEPDPEPLTSTPRSPSPATPSGLDAYPVSHRRYRHALHRFSHGFNHGTCATWARPCDRAIISLCIVLF